MNKELRRPFTAILLLAALLLSSCKGVNDITFTGADGFELKGMENNAVQFAADVGVRNPSGIAFKVSEVNLKAIIDGNFVGTLTATGKIRVPAHSDSSYRMNFSLQLANVLTGASTLYSLSRKKQVTVDMQGYVKARSWLTTRKVDIQETQVIDVPKNYR
jgi:LEA14-like dessication related protein